MQWGVGQIYTWCSMSDGTNLLWMMVTRQHVEVNCFFGEMGNAASGEVFFTCTLSYVFLIRGGKRGDGGRGGVGMDRGILLADREEKKTCVCASI